MRNLWLTGLLLLACSAWGFAQTGGSTGSGGTGGSGSTAQSSTEPSGSSAAATAPTDTTGGNQTAVEGCLSGSDGNYTLTDSQGATYQLKGKDSDLRKHVGHKVRVQGTAGDTHPSDIKAGDVTKSPRTTEQTTMAGSPSGQVFNVDHVRGKSGSCPNTSGK